MDPKEIRNRVLEHLRRKGLRVTKERTAIIEAAFGSSRHFTAEELLEEARKLVPSVSRATVYRTLPLLLETGLLHRLDLDRGERYYDPNYATHPDHNHLICLDCHKIFEFEDNGLEARENEITRALGFSPAAKHLRIEATCQRLRELGFCQNRG
jgi:Fur family ferric uptake transcriptional regulator